MGGTRSALLDRLALAASVGQTLVLRPLSLNEGVVRLWPYACANGEHTVDVLRRLRTEWPADKLIIVWDGASYHRAGVGREAAEALNIDLVPLPGYSPDFMPVEALWRWLREDVTYHHCHPTAEDLSRRVAAFEDRL